MEQEHRRAFHTLDGLRGIAALLVVARHVGPLGAGVSLPENFLAVDLFFLLSGFVIAYAYDNRLGRPGFKGRFLLIRLIRLYPLYLLGLVIGALYRVGSVLNGTEGWTAGHLAHAVLVGVLLIPQTALSPLGSSTLDTPTWTLLPELAANMVYALFYRWLSRVVLAMLVGIGALGLIVCRLRYGTLDAGWDLEKWPIITSRLLFSFFGGVLLFKVLGDRRRTRPWVSWLCVAGVGASLSVTPPEAGQAVYELALVLGVFPLVVWVGCQSEPGRRTSHLFRFLGLTSYAVYVLHQPAAALFARVLERGLHINVDFLPVAHAAFAAFVLGLVVASWLIDSYYDMPVRRWLTRHLGPHRPTQVM